MTVSFPDLDARFADLERESAALGARIDATIALIDRALAEIRARLPACDCCGAQALQPLVEVIEALGDELLCADCAWTRANPTLCPEGLEQGYEPCGRDKPKHAARCLRCERELNGPID